MEFEKLVRRVHKETQDVHMPKRRKVRKDGTREAYTNAYSDTNGGIGCLTYHGEMMDTRSYTNAGQDLYLRVADESGNMSTNLDITLLVGEYAHNIMLKNNSPVRWFTWQEGNRGDCDSFFHCNASYDSCYDFVIQKEKKGEGNEKPNFIEFHRKFELLQYKATRSAIT
ncbi:hypothetical protein Q3G72_028121 [Acer saccharum]|nr:hypothetical protein Q3G72_028121 [Acer saccharum]